MPSFIDFLEKRVAEVNSLLCIGLDPHVDQLVEPTAQAAKQFCREIIESTIPYAAAFKPNAAFFEAFGAEGATCLQEVINMIPENIPVIFDAKRGDIGTTSSAYATAAYDVYHSHAITLNAYMGLDSITPFITSDEKGAFILCKTSNPSSVDFQELLVVGRDGEKRMLYEEVVRMVNIWNTKNNLGVVVGATDVEALRNVRKIAPKIWILAPGLGAQGGDLEMACHNGLSVDGSHVLFPVSRGISKSKNPGAAAMEFRDAINNCRSLKIESSRITLLPFQSEFISFAMSQKVLKFGSFTLKSGRKSPYFFNAGLFKSGSALLNLGKFYASAIVHSGIQFDVLFGPAYKGIPLCTSVAMALSSEFGIDVGVSYNRKEVKDHGEGGSIVGEELQGKRVLVVDDVITAGTAIRETMNILHPAGAIPVGVVIALDRQEKVSEDSPFSAVQSVQNEFSIPVISIVGLNNLLSFIQVSSEFDEQTVAAIVQYQQVYGV